MNYIQGRFVIKRKDSLSKNCYSFVIDCGEIAKIASPGQFAHVKANGFSLRRPISICEIDRQNGTIRLVFEIRGRGTEEIARLNAGDAIDIMAPLGNGFSILEKSKNIIVVGGGIGVPPLLEVAKQYGENAAAIIGFRSANAVILKEDFEKYGVDTVLCTDDGSAGQKGYVSNALEEMLSTNGTAAGTAIDTAIGTAADTVGKTDMIYACGPNLMLKAVIELAQKYNVPCEVSMEERMGCGVGACLVCACKTVKSGEEYYAHVCKDGPVFSSKEVLL